MPRGELLFEVRSEEIPARMLRSGIRALSTRLFEELIARDLPPKEIETRFTPRRLAVIVRGLPEAQKDREETVFGPPTTVAFDENGNPTSALLGFAKRCGVDPAALERVERDGKGEYLVARQSIAGKPTREILAELLPRALTEIPWPKTMKWGASSGPWARPIHAILALFSGEVVPFSLFGIESDVRSAGHPILSPRTFAVRGVRDWERKLESRGIVPSFAKRRRILSEKMETAARSLNGSLVPDEDLLDRLAAVCEVPGLVVGHFDPAYLDLPREVLTTSLRDHQSAFTVERESGLLPAFLTVMDRPDDPSDRVRLGNEWVVRARLADARFFFDEDRKVRLIERAESLSHLSFHDRLGSYADKTERVAALARTVVEQLGWKEELEDVLQAARLLKADLSSEMVKEFTSLEGVMGGIYARLEGHPEAVWEAIYDQYLPAGTEDPLPRTRSGLAVGLADRLDTLAGLFGAGHQPTGSKDPFGLRRSAQGAVRIVLEGKLSIDLDLLAARAVRLYGNRLELSGEEVLERVRPFLRDRLRFLLGREGFEYDEIEAALAAGDSDLPDTRARVEALHAVREEPGFLEVALAAKRIANIVGDETERPVAESLFVDQAERDLHAAAGALRKRVEESAESRDYATALRAIAGFADVLDRFFVEVLVMDEDVELRRNRIAMLQSIERTFGRVAELTSIVVDKAEQRARENRSMEENDEGA